MQAAMQPFVDSAISKTINCPEDIRFERFRDIYVEAYELGLKGCTTYRPNPVTGAVLSREAPAAEDAEPSAKAEAQAAKDASAQIRAGGSRAGRAASST